jgi:hypothetical protein
MAEVRRGEPAGGEWSWAAHEGAQRKRCAQRDLVDKLAWLEEAHRLVLFLREQRSHHLRTTSIERKG